MNQSKRPKRRTSMPGFGEYKFDPKKERENANEMRTGIPIVVERGQELGD